MAYMEKYEEEAIDGCFEILPYPFCPEDESSRFARNGGICLLLLHGLASQETVKFTVTAIRTPELTNFFLTLLLYGSCKYYLSIYSSVLLIASFCLRLFDEDYVLIFQCMLNVPPFSSTLT
jgi:hypothetical protein